MNRYILGLAAVAAVSVALMNPTTVEARGARGHHSVARHHGSYHHGHYRFNHYRARDYRNWSHWRWNTRYGCYYYQCPTDNSWYYWYQPGNCYLPTDSATAYPPTATTFNSNVGTTPPLPPGL
jgi:hypothetical protein